MQQLILASTSTYRRELLARLQLPFRQVDPKFEEETAGAMAAEALVQCNTLGKAYAVLAQYPETTVIASDQIAICNERILGKPGTLERATEQLRQSSGGCVRFLTGVALISAHSERFEIIPFEVRFRNLTEHEIRTYLTIEQPFDCAGSFKSEGLGITLFESMHGDDPTALVGLPLIRLSQWLKPLAHIT